METKNILCSDVYINLEGFITAQELINNSDIIIIGAPHDEYSNVEIPKEKILVDVWNFFGKGGLF